MRVAARDALVMAAKVALGAIFVVAGALKLGDPAGFATSISHYQLYPQLSSYLAVLLPPTEILAGLAVIAAPVPWRRGAALCLGVLTAMFTVGAVAALARGLDVECGCFGSSTTRVTMITVVRDVAMLATAAAIVVWDRALRRR